LSEAIVDARAFEISHHGFMGGPLRDGVLQFPRLFGISDAEEEVEFLSNGRLVSTSY